MDDELVLPALPPPQKEDILFGGANYKPNKISLLECDTEYFYALGYRKAAKLLAEQISNESRELDLLNNESSRYGLIYPIVYLYRHYIELILKNCTISALRILDKSPDESEVIGHKLDVLWTNLRPLLNPVCEIMKDAPYPEEHIEGIESYIRQLHEHDPDGQRFRYAKIRRNNKPSLKPGLASIDIKQFHECMEKLSEYLEGISGWFDYVLDVKTDYESYVTREIPE